MFSAYWSNGEKHQLLLSLFLLLKLIVSRPCYHQRLKVMWLIVLKISSGFGFCFSFFFFLVLTEPIEGKTKKINKAINNKQINKQQLCKLFYIGLKLMCIVVLKCCVVLQFSLGFVFWCLLKQWRGEKKNK